MPSNIILKQNATKLLNDYLKKRDVFGEFANWTFNMKGDFFAQGARNFQVLIQKFATIIKEIIERPKIDIDTSYMHADMKYLVCTVLGDRDFLKYSILYDAIKEKNLSIERKNARTAKEKINVKHKFVKDTVNGEANRSKHYIRQDDLYKDRILAKKWTRAYNDIVDRVYKKIKLKDIKAFMVSEKCIKGNGEPTSNYNYLMPIKGQPDYEEKKERQDRMFNLFKKTLVIPEDYYVQFKAIKYQRDTILKEVLDSKWNQIRKDHLDHSSEIEYIMNSIGNQTFKINYLICQLIYDNIKHKKLLNLAKEFLLEEIERNNKIIDYTSNLVAKVEDRKTNLISSTGIVHSNTKGLIIYIDYKEKQNDKLQEQLNTLKNIIIR